MTLRRSLARLLLVGSLAAAGLVAAAPPAGAFFHFMSIREVLPDGPGGEDFVELQMYSPGQTQLNGHTLTVYDNGGNDYPLVLSGNVGNGDNQRTILIGSSATVLGVTPDYTGLSTSMSSSGGAVCFDVTLVDCVEWGTGVVAVAAGNPAAAPTAGQSIERKITPGCPTLLEASDDTGDSATDFAVQPTPNPEPNSATPNETACAPEGGAFSLQGLKAKVKGGRATITGSIDPPAPGDQVSLTFFANGSPLRKIATKSATLNPDSKFKKRFKVPVDSTRCKVKVAFMGSTLGKKKFKC